ncbi:MAG: hypothetical protein MMC33_003242 [Icmadophila ericetorum]|nr:hypothetical protein [Icmadophila ericetorum]
MLLETAAAVASIVSCYNSTYTLQKAKEKERSEAASSQALVLSSRSDTSKGLSPLSTAPYTIRSEYDRGYEKLGQPFAIGDSIGRNQLHEQLLFLESMIAGVRASTMSPDIRRYNTVKNGTIRALSDQYSRMLTAAPIIVSPLKRITVEKEDSRLLDGAPFCSYAERLQKDNRMDPQIVDNALPDQARCPKFVCPECSASGIYHEYVRKCDGRPIWLKRRFYAKVHVRPIPGMEKELLVKCPFCKDPTLYRQLYKFNTHLELHGAKRLLKDTDIDLFSTFTCDTPRSQLLGFYGFLEPVPEKKTSLLKRLLS